MLEMLPLELKKKKVWLHRRDNPIRLKPKTDNPQGKPMVTDFEIGLLNEFIETRFGLKKRVTAYDMMLAQVQDKHKKSKSIDKLAKKNIKDEFKNDSLPDMSFMSDRNPYLIDFKKSMLNHGKEITDALMKNPRFQKNDFTKSQVFESVNLSVTHEDVMYHRKRTLSKKPSLSKIYIDKCKKIVDSASLSSITLQNRSDQDPKGFELPPIANSQTIMSEMPNPQSKSTTNYDLVENSKQRTHTLKSIISTLDQKYFTPIHKTDLKGTSKNPKISKNPKPKATLSLQSMSKDGAHSNSQFNMAKSYNIKWLYKGADPFLRRKQMAYRQLIQQKQVVGDK